MANKIYINWTNEEYYTSLNDVREAFLSYASYSEFEDFLDCRYSMEEVFNFTENERKAALEDYNESLDFEMEGWIREYLTTIEVDTVFKGE